MKLRLAVAAISALALSACTTSPVATTNSSQQKIQLGGNSYVISQLTPGTWTATSQNAGKPVPRGATDRALLVEAIAKTSGCKVTDVNYSRDGLQLDAQVDCGGLHDN